MKKSLKDFEEVYNFFTRKDLVGDITDDNIPDMFDVVKKILSRDIVLMPSPGTCFVISFINSVLYEAHLNTTECDKGNVGINTLKTAEWLKGNTGIKVLMSFIPIIYPATLHYAKKIGMEKIGEIKNGFLKNGECVDNIIMSAGVETIIRKLSWQQL